MTIVFDSSSTCANSEWKICHVLAASRKSCKIVAVDQFRFWRWIYAEDALECQSYAGNMEKLQKACQKIVEDDRK